MDNDLLFHFKVENTDKTHTLEVNVNTFMKDPTSETIPSDLSTIFKDFDNLVNFLKQEVLGRVIPSSSTSLSDEYYYQGGRAPRYPSGGALPPMRGDYDVEDEFSTGLYRPPFGVGSGDIYPTTPGIGGIGGPPGNLIGPGSFAPYTPGRGGITGRGRGPGRGSIPPGIGKSKF